MEFVDVLTAMDAVLVTLRHRTPVDDAFRVLLSGDANFQPSCLCAQGRGHPAREGLWSALLMQHGLRLPNPSSLGAVSRRVSLLCYGKPVEVRRGDTLHSCTPGRSIDLTAASWDMEVQLLLHNGVHCKENSACATAHCKDFCRSDHFLQESRVGELRGWGRIEEVLPSFPKRWLLPECWKPGLDAFGPCLTRLAELLEGPLASACADRTLVQRECSKALAAGLCRDVAQLFRQRSKGMLCQW